MCCCREKKGKLERILGIPGVNFISILKVAFLYKSVLHSFSIFFVIFKWKEIGLKAASKMKSIPVVDFTNIIGAKAAFAQIVFQPLNGDTI